MELRTSTYTYLLGCPRTKTGVLIDSTLDRCEADLKTATEMGVNVKFALETHIHADHVTGAKKLKSLKSDIKSITGAASCECDRVIKDNEIIQIGDLQLLCLHTPGHTKNCYSFVTVPGKEMVFTGDALLIRGCGRTGKPIFFFCLKKDFQEGNYKLLHKAVNEKLFTLPDDCIVWPGHNYAGEVQSTIGEEKKFNPRLGNGKGVEEFGKLMDDVHKRIIKPKFLEYSVTNNLKGGKKRGDVGIFENFFFLPSSSGLFKEQNKLSNDRCKCGYCRCFKKFVTLQNGFQLVLQIIYTVKHLVGKQNIPFF
ncbi:hypothetical protein RFI_27019 [Reticulomyxa filosa]|uniref:Metallo-beta-lactamase domain-containing protein n=1 Tax=Reticulomyxa filosa TaxID=46433 RepID=X6MA52_RETFI|nr:hypothetical protein RFI_27019 [Reticulomyxa filosa]|eukprot:ETO10357.1 hypothetical protein RFI_27019 [Reticulomyxa filosa]